MYRITIQAGGAVAVCGVSHVQAVKGLTHPSPFDPPFPPPPGTLLCSGTRVRSRELLESGTLRGGGCLLPPSCRLSSLLFLKGF